MKRIEFDIVNGTVEVARFSTSSLYYGFFDSYEQACSVLNHHCADKVGAMNVDDNVFEKIDKEYGIIKL